MKRIAVLAVAVLMVATNVTICAAMDPRVSWENLTEESRTMYVMGLHAGGIEAVNAFMTEIAPKDRNGEVKLNPDGTFPGSDVVDKLYGTALIRNEPAKVAEVMTDLYRNPANAYVSTTAMAFIADSMLSGRDVSDRLIEARKNGAVLRRVLREGSTGKTSP